MGIRSYLKNIGNALAGRQSRPATKTLHYHAGKNNNSRNSALYDPRSEDAFWQDDYENYSARAREVLRNFPILSWMIDKHADFTSTIDVEFHTKLDWLNDKLELLYEWWSKAENFDAGKRTSLYQYLRINETQRIINGDMGTLKMADGRVMAFDSDQIGTEFGHPNENWFRGVHIDPFTTRPTKYRLRRRNIQDGNLSNNFFEIPANNFYLHACRKHYPNLIRGISPLAPGINAIQDCYEGINWHLVKMKIAAMFGMVTYETKNALPGMRHNPEPLRLHASRSIPALAGIKTRPHANRLRTPDQRICPI